MQALQLLRLVDHTSFSVICCGRRIVIACDAVTHVSKFANELVIYTLTGNYNAQHSLEEILDALPRNKFYRIHRSHIISLDLLGNKITVAVNRFNRIKCSSRVPPGAVQFHPLENFA